MTFPGNWQLAWVNQETPALPQPAIDYAATAIEYRQLEAALQQANERNDGHAIATVHGRHRRPDDPFARRQPAARSGFQQ
ncbi:putative ABC transporter ATP-binding protein YheS [Klebsiella pneumoniae]|nr:putative ABC transporter ATP-binding protein YheS [Klebsiella pneumoniae]